MEAVKFTNTHYNISTTPFCFIKDKLGVVSRFFDSYDLKNEFIKQNGVLEQEQFSDPHLYGSDIEKLLTFLESKIDYLQVQTDTDAIVKYMQDLMKVLPPLKGEKQNVWYIFKKDVKEDIKEGAKEKQYHPEISCPKSVAKAFDIEDIEQCEYSKSTY